MEIPNGRWNRPRLFRITLQTPLVPTILGRKNRLGKALGAHELENELPDYDMALVAPQIRHRFVSLSDIGKKLNKKVQLIPSTGYTPMGAPSVIEMIKKELS